MKSEAKIDEQIEKLRKQVHIMKKARMSKDDFLYSGEFSLIKQIYHYNKENDENPTLIILSNLLGITQATVTPLVDRLVAKELVIKEVSPKDKRAKLISLTPKGEEYLKQNIKEEYSRLQALLDCLGDDDTNDLIRILDKVINHFNEKN